MRSPFCHESSPAEPASLAHCFKSLRLNLAFTSPSFHQYIMVTVSHYNYSNAFNIEPHKLCLEPRCHSMTSICAPPIKTPHVYRLPVEMLSRIFEIGTHGSDDPNDAVDFPLRVSSVSRHFRSVACATPSLWTTITFDSPRPSWYDSKSEDAYEYTYARDLLWISRSKACSLNLILSFRDMSWNFNEDKHYFRREHMEHILSFLLPHAHRIRRFTLICDTFSPLHSALSFLAEKGTVMGRLETLELYRCNEFPAEHPVFYPWDLTDPIVLLGDSPAPRLKHVVLSGVHINWSRSKTSLSNLQTLELAYHSRDVRPSVYDFMEILAASPNISSLVVTASGPSIPLMDYQEDGCTSYLGDGFPRVHLPLLSTLEIGYQFAVDVLALLRIINAPSVTNLCIRDTSRPSESETAGGSSVLASLADPSSIAFPQLEMLCLHSVKATAQAFGTYLGTQPGIRAIKLIRISGDALSALVSPSPSSPQMPPCPALKELSFQFMSGTKIGSVARARAAAGMALNEVLIYFADEISEQEISLAKSYSMVKFFGHPDDDSDDESMDWGENDDPYAPGGAFNDPEFDAMFS